ncbi:MAG: PP2C family protein-serine/threonine phosphatase [Candidatus Sumerlaeia bacterium]
MIYEIITAVVILALFVVIWHYHLKVRAYQNVHEEIRNQREAAVDLLNRIGLSINTSLDLDGALGTIAEYIVETTKAESGAIYLLDSEGRNLHARAVVGLFPPMHQTSDYVLTKQKYLSEKIRKDTIEIGEGIIGFVASTGESVLITDALSDPRVPKTATDFLQINSMLVAPLRIRQKVIGVFAVVNKKGNIPFGDADLRLVNQLAVQAALTVDIVRLYEHQAAQDRIEQELQVATEFQQMLLPQELPEVKHMDIAAFSQPALEVGGDFYDLFWIEEGKRFGVAIVDVSGKSIPGAIVMAMLRSALKVEAASCDSPREVLRRVNRHIVRDTKENVFVTVSYGIIDLEKKTLRFARAGHEPLIVLNPDQRNPRVCMPEGIALGLVRDEMFDVLEECEIQLHPNDTLVLYTDGCIEANNSKDEQFGQDEFILNLQKRLDQSAQRQIEGILKDIQDFTEGIPQQDDITLVIVRMI